MSRRDLVLEEMGIAPVWRVRATPASAQAEPAVSAAREPAADAPLQVAQGEVAMRAADSVAASVSDRRGNLDSAAPSHPDAPLESALLDEAVIRSSLQSSSGTERSLAQRRESILQMDWPTLQAEVAQCVACPLHAKRNKAVFGVGDERASWLFVGEGPGAEEDAKGEPFVGQAGRLLDNMLGALGMKRGEDVYIANVVKCRPPNNRNPESGEMSCCEPYLTRQIELIRPKLIVAMGKIAASHLLRTDASIASLRGRVHEYRGTPLVVTYHPAYLLRTLPDKAKAWTDLCFARERMDAIAAGAGTVQDGR